MHTGFFLTGMTCSLPYPTTSRPPLVQNNQQKDAKWFGQIEASGKFTNTWWHAAKYIRKAK